MNGGWLSLLHHSDNLGCFFPLFVRFGVSSHVLTLGTQRWLIFLRSPSEDAVTPRVRVCVFKDN